MHLYKPFGQAYFAQSLPVIAYCLPVGFQYLHNRPVHVYYAWSSTNILGFIKECPGVQEVLEDKGGPKPSG